MTYDYPPNHPSQRTPPPMATKRRSDHLRGEAAFLPRSVEDLAVLRRRILDAGHTDQVASGIVGWLVDKAADYPDRTGPSTRSRYRKVLAEIEPLYDPTPDGDRRPLEVVGGEGRGTARQRRGVRKTLVALAVVGAGAALGIGSNQHAAEASASARTAPPAAELAESRPFHVLSSRRRRRGLRRAA